MNRHHAVPLFFGHIENHAVAQNTGHGHHNIQFTEAIQSGLDDGFPACHSCHRLHAGHGLSTCCFDFGYHIPGNGIVGSGPVEVNPGVDDYHLGSLGRHQQCDAAPNAAPGAGDYRYLIL